MLHVKTLQLLLLLKKCTVEQLTLKSKKQFIELLMGIHGSTYGVPENLLFGPNDRAFSQEESEDWYDRSIKRHKLKLPSYWIIRNQGDREVIGTVGLSQQITVEGESYTPHVHCAVLLVPNCQGHKVAFEVMVPLLKYHINNYLLFSLKNNITIILGTHPGNKLCLRILESIKGIDSHKAYRYSIPNRDKNAPLREREAVEFTFPLDKSQALLRLGKFAAFLEPAIVHKGPSISQKRKTSNENNSARKKSTVSRSQQPLHIQSQIGAQQSPIGVQHWYNGSAQMIFNQPSPPYAIYNQMADPYQRPAPVPAPTPVLPAPIPSPVLAQSLAPIFVQQHIPAPSSVPLQAPAPLMPLQAQAPPLSPFSTEWVISPPNSPISELLTQIE